MNHSRELSVTLTTKQIEGAYVRGLLSTQGFTLLSVAAGLRLSEVEKACERIGISKASFFRAKAHLKKMQESGSFEKQFGEGSL